MGEQPRERPVPCRFGGVDLRTRQPRELTMNANAVCDRHTAFAADLDAQRKAR